ncbi:c-type cytochrome [Pontibacter anaerobius]|uniref:C-type cytochrome n=1 Tax=Pontibacter anaerobius TaxID=2993940 RepID=A0ABT3RH91_9BACT|nr:c-type cytochrome [Pontibacter anaerobius]MCX2740925.1 c-type cytochrome [Pontibacter anaerobius]
MKKHSIYSCFLLSTVWVFSQCSEASTENDMQKAGFDSAGQQGPEQLKNGGYASQIEFGEHLVLSIGCHDCHTPKMVTEKGLEPDFSRALSGHPSKMPPPDVDRAELEKKGLTASDHFTAWVGPWGISYAANLTSDKTGIGTWQEQNFITSIREGKHKGIATGRDVLPPMPWPMYRNLTDEELKAIFAYLKSTKPIQNTVPPPEPPVSAGVQK